MYPILNVFYVFPPSQSHDNQELLKTYFRRSIGQCGYRKKSDRAELHDSKRNYILIKKIKDVLHPLSFTKNAFPHLRHCSTLHLVISR